MAISNLNQFLVQYFRAHQCDIIKNEDGVLVIQLTEEMDRTLMNRPFYWHYMKQMGQAGEPMQLTLVTNLKKEVEKGERIHFGSPRLQQIINHLKAKERFTKLYEQLPAVNRVALHPWLVVNMKLSYIGLQKKDELFSIGLNLVNGMMKTDMIDQLKHLHLQPAIPDFCYTISPLIMPGSGFKRIEKVLTTYIEEQDHSWAEATRKELLQEKELLQQFYDGQEDEDNQFEKELTQIIERYEPKITMNVTNGGMFYLAQ
ncbi:YqhG family protein [Virgibacillus soli]|uniref:YqhG family protein n=1 Tax=Paracerasibacillus soli TaxID=480284 RepID=A0ABU5CPY3_9BACI|nr:YqhG family protein [Virgibacillus soli]MDY0408426.1 YqhG family protein [Virgibacillus soli]